MSDNQNEHNHAEASTNTDALTAVELMMHMLKALPGQAIKMWPYIAQYKKWVALTLLATLGHQAVLLAVPFLFGEITDVISTVVQNSTAPEESYLHFGLLLIALAVCRSLEAFTGAMELRYINRFQSHVMLNGAKDVFKQITSLSYRFHSNNTTGETISIFSRGVKAMETFMDAAIFNMIPTIVFVGTLGVLFLGIDSILAIIIIGLVVTYAAFTVWSSFVMQRNRRDANDSDDTSTAHMSDTFMNAIQVLLFRQEEIEIERFNELRNEWRVHKQSEWDGYIWIQVVQTIIEAVFALSAVGYTGYQVLHGHLDLAHLVMVIAYLGTLRAFLREFQYHFRNVNDSRTDLDAFFSYFDIENEIQEAPDALPLNVTKGEVEFANVTFGYKADDQVFTDISFTAEAGTTVALVGPSGAGKSTIMKLLWRFFDIENGTIHIDGQDIAGVTLDSLRRNLSIVPQDTALFNTTVFKNIAYGCGKVTQEQVEAAARNADIHERIMRMKKGYQSLVGERGVRLSGGEKQRIAIARAFLQDAPILVLDEATSSLDPKAEATIQKALTQLMKGRTTLVIAHRLSTILHADNIVVLDKDDSGSHVEQVGNHETLISQGGLYEQLWNQQVGGYIQ